MKKIESLYFECLNSITISKINSEQYKELSDRIRQLNRMRDELQDRYNAIPIEYCLVPAPAPAQQVIVFNPVRDRLREELIELNIILCDSMLELFFLGRNIEDIS